PRRMLALAIFGFFARMPTDGRRIEENLRATKSRKTRALGVPLIPTDQRADLVIPCVEGLEPEVTGREVKLLVKERIVGDVHLAVHSEQFATRINHYCRIVIETRSATFKERRDDHDVSRFCEFR